MENSFTDVERQFHQLKGNYRRGEISRREFIDKMKSLRIKDDKGHFWMIGAETGKWYFYDGKDWRRADPPSQKEKKANCPRCGFENKPDAAACSRCGANMGEDDNVCPDCGAALDRTTLECPQCNRKKENKKARVALSEPGTQEAALEETRFFLRGISPLSLFFFLGTIGVIVGIILGAFAGVTNQFAGFVQILPAFLRELQGKLMGAVIFAALGAILGFLVAGIIGFIGAIITNFVLSFIGGIQVIVEKLTGRD
jgi:hypothetical protein